MTCARGLKKETRKQVSQGPRVSLAASSIVPGLTVMTTCLSATPRDINDRQENWKIISVLTVIRNNNVRRRKPPRPNPNYQE